MSSPPVKVQRYFDFTTYATINPDKPLPGAAVDVELNRVKSTTDQTIDRLALIQRDDGALRNEIVTADSLAPDLSIGFQVATTWTPNVLYMVGNTIWQGTGFYLNNVQHTSAATWAADQGPTNNYWTLLVDMGVSANNAAASAAAAHVSETNAAASAVASQNSATASQASAVAADASKTASTNSANASQASAVASANSATASLNSANASQASAVNSHTSELNAKASEIAAAASAGTWINPFDQTLNKADTVHFAGLGVGMVPVNVVDITQNQNGFSTLRLMNNDPGVNALSVLQVYNGADSLSVYMTGPGWNGGGIAAARRGVVQSSSFLSLVALGGPILFAANGGNETARFAVNGSFYMAGAVDPGHPAGSIITPQRMCGQHFYGTDSVNINTGASADLVNSQNATGLHIINGSGSVGGNAFVDVVLSQYFQGGAPVVFGQVNIGNPPARAYFIDGGTGCLGVTLTGGIGGLWSMSMVHLG